MDGVYKEVGDVGDFVVTSCATPLLYLPCFVGAVVGESRLLSMTSQTLLLTCGEVHV